MAQKRILIVDDDPNIRGGLKLTLKDDYALSEAEDGQQALKSIRKNPPDLIVLDFMMPNMNGRKLCQVLRQDPIFRHLPIIMLSGQGEIDDRVGGLDAGADDYLTKPFTFDVLLARIRALVRRGGSQRQERLLYHDLELDRIRHVALRRGERLILTPKEFQLLEYLLLHPEEVVRRTDLLEKVWDLHFDPMSNVVDVHVANLRRKLLEAGDQPLIHTIRGVGYMLSVDPP